MTEDVEELQTMVTVLRKDNLALQERVDDLMNEMSRLYPGCRQELCLNWTGHGCACDLLDLRG